MKETDDWAKRPAGPDKTICTGDHPDVHCAPKAVDARVIGKQVLRSGTSVGADYREAYRSRSKAEFIAKSGDCLKEIEETAYWLELLIEGGIVPENSLQGCKKSAAN